MTPLRRRMLEDMQVRNLSPNTQRAYLDTVARFARHFGRSPAVLEPEQIRAYHGARVAALLFGFEEFFYFWYPAVL